MSSFRSNDRNAPVPVPPKNPIRAKMTATPKSPPTSITEKLSLPSSANPSGVDDGGVQTVIHSGPYTPWPRASGDGPRFQSTGSAHIAVMQPAHLGDGHHPARGQTLDGPPL